MEKERRGTIVTGVWAVSRDSGGVNLCIVYGCVRLVGACAGYSGSRTDCRQGEMRRGEAAHVIDSIGHLDKGSTDMSCAKGWMGREGREAAVAAPLSASRP